MGGWASTKTQGTIITPQAVLEVVMHLPEFEKQLNQYLSIQGLEPIKIGDPVGSGTYYQKDLEHDPNREYGDIDVQFIIKRNESLSANQNIQQYMTAVKDFTHRSSKYETETGKNVIFDIGKDRFVQVDLVAIFYENLDWTKTQAPEHGTKGVLSASLYSALAKALEISISDKGIQARTKQGKLVPFRMKKDTQLVNISANKISWGIDVADFFGANEVSQCLKKYSGMKQEVKIKDIVNTIKGIAETLENNHALPDGYATKTDFLETIKNIYLEKINSVINSSKFNKAETPEAKRKAEDTKQMLKDKSQEIAGEII